MNEWMSEWMFTCAVDSILSLLCCIAALPSTVESFRDRKDWNKVQIEDNSFNNPFNRSLQSIAPWVRASSNSRSMSNMDRWTMDHSSRFSWHPCRFHHQSLLLMTLLQDASTVQSAWPWLLPTKSSKASASATYDRLFDPGMHKQWCPVWDRRHVRLALFPMSCREGVLPLQGSWCALDLQHDKL